MKTVHVPVLLNEVVASLVPEANRASAATGAVEMPWYLDGTLGGAGHALAIARVFAGKVNIIGLDRDPSALERDRETLSGACTKLILENENFRNLDRVLAKHSIQTVDMILLDLGLSSDELEHSGKGFSFQRDEPLLMTMGDPSTYAFTAKDILNGWAEEDIANVIYAYGEETAARRIARAIVTYREKKQFETTHELAEVVKSAVPAFRRRLKIHPATKTFQALRIAVNDELTAIGQGLDKAYAALCPGGRLAVISFHSLEDRIVKQFMRDRGSRAKAIKPTDAEMAANPRSRSAKLRVIEKTS